MTVGDVTRSYLIAAGDLSLDDRKSLRSNSDEVLKAAATRLAIRDRLEDLIIRDTLPNADLALATSDDWLVAGAGVAGTELQYIGTTLAVDRCVAFYGVGSESVPQQISRVRLTLGAASAQIRGVFQLEQLNSRLEPLGYFSESIVFTRQEFVRIMVMPRTGGFAANTQRLHFLARTIEPIGSTVSAPSV
jgi:hypothetical protein